MSGAGGAGSSRVTSKGTRGTRGRGRGRGRGGGRSGKAANKKGRGAAKAGPFKVSDPDITVFYDAYDDDDDICNQALSIFEHQNNDVAKAFAAVNEETELPGFDASAGDIWIYPTNKPVRDYQFNIVETSLYNNTLVSLPTGLGKTFIAAVVMFNFHRWYPDSLIVFMAPTRPLVAQQLEACHNLMGIAPSKMIELTGHTIPKRRLEIWKEKKVFFLTPQVMMSDLDRGFCAAQKVRLVIVDEAHKAQGNYAYVQVIARLAQRHKCFRVLALSATPGNATSSIQEVLKNLLISRIELRSEDSSDILPYTRQKEVETVVVQLEASVKLVYDKILEIYQGYTGKLMQQNALNSRGGSFTQYQLLKARETFRTENTVKAKIPAFRKGMIELDFATCITLAHSLELITIHGLRSFYSFLYGVLNKVKGCGQVTSELKKNTNVEQILEELRTQLKITSDNSTRSLNTSGFLSISGNDNSSSLVDDNVDYTISHPKFKALKEIVQKHFENYNSTNRSTRVMIFSQYRDSVQEIGNMLNALRPLVKPMVFLGQSSSGATGRGLKQKEQVEVVQRFRKGGYNVLVSTSVGEEGLDIGEVDLIICFDCNRSPTRLIQRMGRTGRQRQGRTVFLLTQGKEESMYRHSVYQSNNISKNILDVSKFEGYLYKQSPRMIPAGIKPQCYKMDIILSSEQNQPSNRALGGGNAQRPQNAPSAPVNGNLAAVSRIGNKENERSQELTVTQCFKKYSELMQEYRIVKPAPSANDEIVPNGEDSDPEFTLRHFQENSRTRRPFWDDIDYQTICGILNVKNVTKETVAQCVRIPKSTKKLEWLPKYNDISPDAICCKGVELDCIREKVDVDFMFGDSSTHCGCGLVYEAEDSFGDDDFEFGIISDVIDVDIKQADEDESDEETGIPVQNEKDQAVKPKNTDINWGKDLHLNPVEYADKDKHEKTFVWSSDDEWGEDFDSNVLEQIEGKSTAKLSVPSLPHFDVKFLLEEAKGVNVNMNERANDDNDDKNSLSGDSSFASIDDQSNSPGPSLTTSQSLEYAQNLVEQTGARLQTEFEEAVINDDDDEVVCLYDELDGSSTTSNEAFMPVRSRPSFEDYLTHKPGKEKVLNSDPEIPSVLSSQLHLSRKVSKAPCTIQIRNSSPELSPIIRRRTHNNMDKSPIRAQNLLDEDSSPEKSPLIQRRMHNNSERSPIIAKRILEDSSSSDKSPIIQRRIFNPDVSNVRVQRDIDDSSPENSSVLNRKMNESRPSTPLRYLFGNFLNKSIGNADINTNMCTTPEKNMDQHSSSSSAEFLSASPERKSNPVVVKPKTDSTKKFIFKKNLTPPSVNFLSQNSFKLDSKTHDDSEVKITPLNSTTKNTPSTSAVWKTWNNSVLSTSVNISKENNANLPASNSTTATTSSNEVLLPSPEPSLRRFVFKKSIAKTIPIAEDDDLKYSSDNSSSNIPPDLNTPLSETKLEETRAKLNLTINQHNSSSSDSSDLQIIEGPKTLKRKSLTARNHLYALSRKNLKPITTCAAERKNAWISADGNKNSIPDTSGSMAQTTSNNKPADKGNTRASGSKRKKQRSEEPTGRRKKASQRGKKNPFVIDEVSVSGDESSDEASDADLDGFDTSFVDEEEDNTVTESQQVRYMKSMKDIPFITTGRVEAPLEPRSNFPLDDFTATQYEPDSFCVTGNEVEYVDVGNFTQAMIKAQADIEREIEEEHNMRLRAQLDMDSSFDAQPQQKRKGMPTKVSKPKRKRIIEFSSEEEQ